MISLFKYRTDVFLLQFFRHDIPHIFNGRPLPGLSMTTIGLVVKEIFYPLGKKMESGGDVGYYGQLPYGR
jgi:hypothetical protein